MAKVAKIEISKEFLEMFLRADFWDLPDTVITSSAPGDLVILGLANAEITSTKSGYPLSFYLFCKSETFEDIPEFAEPPLLKPFTFTVTKVNG